MENRQTAIAGTMDKYSAETLAVINAIRTGTGYYVLQYNDCYIIIQKGAPELEEIRKAGAKEVSFCTAPGNG